MHCTHVQWKLSRDEIILSKFRWNVFSIWNAGTTRLSEVPLKFERSASKFSIKSTWNFNSTIPKGVELHFAIFLRPLTLLAEREKFFVWNWKPATNINFLQVTQRSTHEVYSEIENKLKSLPAHRNELSKSWEWNCHCVLDKNFFQVPTERRRKQPKKSCWGDCRDEMRLPLIRFEARRKSSHWVEVAKHESHGNLWTMLQTTTRGKEEPESLKPAASATRDRINHGFKLKSIVEALSDR